MPRNVTPELLIAFTNEAQEHLAEIGPVVANLDTADSDALKVAFRRSHNLKGSASLLGVSTLSHVARIQEELLETLWGNERPLTDEIRQLLDATFRATVLCVHSPNGRPPDEAAVLASVFIPYRRLHQLPVEGDEAAIRELLPVANSSTEPPPETTAAPKHKSKASPNRTKSSGNNQSQHSVSQTSDASLRAEKDESAVSNTPVEAGTVECHSTLSGVVEPSASELSEITTWLKDMIKVDAEYASIYAEESEESLKQLRCQLAALEAEPGNIEFVQAVRRLMHNLKGASATVGFTAVSKLAHRAESVLDRIAGGEATFTTQLIPLLSNVADTMEDLAARSFSMTTMPRLLHDLLISLESTPQIRRTAQIPVERPEIDANPASQTPSIGHPEETRSEKFESSPPEISVAESDIEPDSLFAATNPTADDAETNADQSPAALLEEESTEARVLKVLESLTPNFIDIDAVLPPNLGTLIPSIDDLTNQKAAATSPTGDTVRVPIERLDALVRLVTELVVNRTSFEQRMQSLNSVKDELRFSLKRVQELATKFAIDFETKTNSGHISLPSDSAAVRSSPTLPDSSDRTNPDNAVPANRVRDEFDALEMDRYTEMHILSRSLTEAASDIHTVQTELGNVTGDFDQLLNRQSLISRELQDRLMQARLVPLGTLESRLNRTVRQAADQVGKKVKLKLEGNSVPIDKTVLDELVDPLTHLLRNAVDHGVEPAELRAALGKSDEATIRIRAFHQGTQLVLQLSDDGGGLKLEALRTRAVQDGHVSAANADSLTKTELQNLIFVHGLSTAANVSELSGRGVGMDAVRTAVHKLKGTISVDSTTEKGTTFSIRLPMTLAITEALFVESAHEKFAIPLQDVLQIIRVERKELDRVGSSPVLRMGGVIYPLISLRDALRLEGAVDDTQLSVPVLFVNVGDKQVAFAVDRIVASREIVVKTLGTHFRHVHGLIGATLLGDGTVVPILNCSEVLEAPATAHVVDNSPSAGNERDHRITVMIVDDSVSVRRITAKILNAAGMETILCRDGVEALETLQRLTTAPDLVLLDVEMPRMDGYELLSTLRSQVDYERLPVVMVTSRSGNKHRLKAEQLGATDYLVKPYDEDELIATIQHHVAESRELVGV